MRYSSLSACLAKLLRMSSLATFDRFLRESRIPARILDYPRIARLSQNRSIIVDYAQIVNFRRFEGKVLHLSDFQKSVRFSLLRPYLCLGGGQLGVLDRGPDLGDPASWGAEKCPLLGDWASSTGLLWSCWEGSLAPRFHP